MGCKGCKGVYIAHTRHPDVTSFSFIGDKPKSVILDCTHVSAVDYTTIQGIIELIADFLRNDVRFAIASAPVSRFEYDSFYITKTCPCNVYPLEPHFYIAKLGYAGVYIFFFFLLQNIHCGTR